MDFTRPLIGALQAPTSCDLFWTTVPASPTATTGRLDVATWPLVDFAGLPRSIGSVHRTSTTQYQLIVRLNFAQPVPFNAVAVLHPDLDATEDAEDVNVYDVYYWTGSQYKRLTDSGDYIVPIPTAPYTSTVKVYDDTTTASSVCVALGYYSWREDEELDLNVDFGEVALMQLIDMQYAPDRASYVITPNQTGAQSLTCQNGRQIQYYSSEPTYSLAAQFDWSDDGSTALAVHKLNLSRMLSGSPLVYIPPSSDPTNWRTSRPLYLVNAAQSPDVINRDGSNYSMTIQGTTQP